MRPFGDSRKDEFNGGSCAISPYVPDLTANDEPRRSRGTLAGPGPPRLTGVMAALPASPAESFGCKKDAPRRRRGMGGDSLGRPEGLTNDEPRRKRGTDPGAGGEKVAPPKPGEIPPTGVDMGLF